MQGFAVKSGLSPRPQPDLGPGDGGRLPKQGGRIRIEPEPPGGTEAPAPPALRAPRARQPQAAGSPGQAFRVGVLWGVLGLIVSVPGSQSHAMPEAARWILAAVLGGSLVAVLARAIRRSGTAYTAGPESLAWHRWGKLRAVLAWKELSEIEESRRLVSCFDRIVLRSRSSGAEIPLDPGFPGFEDLWHHLRQRVGNDRFLELCPAGERRTFRPAPADVFLSFAGAGVLVSLLVPFLHSALIAVPEGDSAASLIKCAGLSLLLLAAPAAACLSVRPTIIDDWVVRAGGLLRQRTVSISEIESVELVTIPGQCRLPQVELTRRDGSRLRLRTPGEGVLALYRRLHELVPSPTRAPARESSFHWRPTPGFQAARA